ncbi:hypothetical protein [Kosmotoga sp. DU53]|nr:hypothetical protein [Kosmotoga sp. DU53]
MFFSASVNYQPWLRRTLTEIVILNLIQDLIIKKAQILDRRFPE